MGKNLKYRIDDKRGYRKWTPEEREKNRLACIKHPLLNNSSEWLKEQYLVLNKTTVQIAKELGCANSTVFVALVRYDIPRRSRKVARQGIKFSKEHIENITKANRIMAQKHTGSSHWNWQGGKSTEYDKKMAATKRHPNYKKWRKAVVADGYCKSCGSANNLEAHHILPKSTHPHLIHDIGNGMCLCKSCHANLHSLDKGVNSGDIRKDNPEPSRVETRKVQRLLEAGTPALITSETSDRGSAPLVRDDIVQIA